MLLSLMFVVFNFVVCVFWIVLFYLFLLLLKILKIFDSYKFLNSFLFFFLKK